MSETTRFKHHRPFPFCSGDAPAPSDPLFDYVAFGTDVLDPAGQAGLKQAMAFWWNLEFITMQPIGSALIDLSIKGFSQTYGIPFVSSGDIVDFNAAGSIVGFDAASPTTSTSVPVLEPSQRVCYSEPFAAITNQSYGSGGSPPTYEQGGFIFKLAFVGGEWRLYYYFFFQIPNAGFSVAAAITNPANTSGLTEVSSGSISIGGQTLSWSAQTDDSVIDSFDLDSNSDFFTYPAP